MYFFKNFQLLVVYIYKYNTKYHKIIHICKNGVCIKISFLLVQNISHQVVLGTSFLTQLYSFYVDNKGLHTKFNKQNLTFDYIKGIKIQ